MNENTPPHGKGLNGSDTAKALISQHRQHHRQAKLATAEIGASATLVNTFAKLDRRLDQRRKKRRRSSAAPIPLMVRRLLNMEKYLGWRYGSILPPGDEGGLDDLNILLSIGRAAGKPIEGYCQKWAPWLTEDEARLACDMADLAVAYLPADDLADRIGITYAVRRLLKIWTIGAIDVRKAEREKLRRQRAASKRKRASKPPKPALKPREKTIIKMIATGICMGELARKARRSPLFRHLENVPLEVRRIVDRLVKAGHLGKRLEPRRERGGTEWFIWRESKTKETAAAQPLPENAPRKTPIFIGSNRGAESCVSIAKLYGKNDLGGVDFEISDVIAARERAVLARAARGAQRHR